MSANEENRFSLIEKDLSDLINKWSIDNDFGVPDVCLARFLMRQLKSLSDLSKETYIRRKGTDNENI